MWKNYSSDYIKNNKASGISLAVAAFISALFLSLLCSLFYNFWQYDIEKIKLEEGDWQGRIAGNLQEEDLVKIQNYSNLEKAVINRKLSGDQKTVVDFYFQNMRTILTDMPQLAELLGVEEKTVEYHHSLLAMYLIRDPLDPASRLLFPFFLFILVMVCFSLVLIIHNSFAVSMNARIHQFGIFSSVGATPGQIRICLLQEAGALCAIPIIAGIVVGVLGSMGIIAGTNVLAGNAAGRHEAQWGYHPMIFGITLLATVLTIFVSAWMPARKLSRMSPLEAVRNFGELKLKRKKHSHILSLLFGIEGELAGNALKAQKKALYTSTLSLTLSFLCFTMVLCFITLSDISTRHTYFERYQDTWDIMVTLKNANLEDNMSLQFGNKLRESGAVRDILIYQKAEAECLLTENMLSSEITEAGGLEAIAGSAVSKTEGLWAVKAPLVIMDDVSFANYCEQMGISAHVDGAVIFNQIWDSPNSSFRYKDFIPYVNESIRQITLVNREEQEKVIEIPILACTEKAPVLREEYDNYALVQFIPASLWKRIKAQEEDADADCFIRVLAASDATLDELNMLEKNIKQLLGQKYSYEIENRIQEKLSNDKIILGYKLVVGGFCTLLALIGIANVFSNTMGFLRQRKREFAQYLSLGMTTAQIRKLFVIEALVIAGRPLLVTLPITVLITGFMITASYLNPVEFLAEAPIFPVAVFSLCIFGFVGLAYFLGGKKVVSCNLVDTLRDDTV